MEIPNNRGDKVSGRFLPPSEVSRGQASPPKRNPQTTQVTAKAMIGCSLQIEGKALLLKTIPTYLIEHGKSCWCLTPNV